MKTELQIAKENVEYYKSGVNNSWGLYVCQQDKEKDQRFLEFLEEMSSWHEKFSIPYMHNMEIKITDLKNAIKEYEDNGI